MKKEMALEKFEQEIGELIDRRRRQILIHSFIYYRMGTSIVDDSTFDRWAYELVSLQNTYLDIAEKCIYADAFRGFDGTTGYDLPLYEYWIESKARQLIEYSNERS